MAIQGGPIIWVKTFGCVSFYKRRGMGCVRMKSNLTAERWRKDPAFEGSRLSAACMALGSQLGSAVYKTIPLQHRRYPHYKELVGIAQKTLRQGYNIQQVNKVLHFAVARYLRKLEAADPNRKPERSPFAATLSLKSKPTYTAVMPHQLVLQQFTAPTSSRPALMVWPVTMPPRGSPITIGGCTQKTGTSALPFYHLPSTTPVKVGHFKWQGMLCPYPKVWPQHLQNRSQTTPKNTRKSSPESIFCPLAF